MDSRLSAKNQWATLWALENGSNFEKALTLFMSYTGNGIKFFGYEVPPFIVCLYFGYEHSQVISAAIEGFNSDEDWIGLHKIFHSVKVLLSRVKRHLKKDNLTPDVHLQALIDMICGHLQINYLNLRDDVDIQFIEFISAKFHDINKAPAIDKILLAAIECKEEMVGCLILRSHLYCLSLCSVMHEAFKFDSAKIYMECIVLRTDDEKNFLLSEAIQQKRTSIAVALIKDRIKFYRKDFFHQFVRDISYDFDLKSDHSLIRSWTQLMLMANADCLNVLDVENKTPLEDADPVVRNIMQREEYEFIKAKGLLFYHGFFSNSGSRLTYAPKDIMREIVAKMIATSSLPREYSRFTGFR